ncbi:MAG: hypothetical protein FMNOHCHN_03787 [Ignavibacteriaceae bacterium]|nr:hypothetical protein [Ignavibacteriaceae bacterium]
MNQTKKPADSQDFISITDLIQRYETEKARALSLQAQNYDLLRDLSDVTRKLNVALDTVNMLESHNETMQAKLTQAQGTLDMLEKQVEFLINK